MATLKTEYNPICKLLTEVFLIARTPNSTVLIHLVKGKRQSCELTGTRKIFISSAVFTAKTAWKKIGALVHSMKFLSLYPAGIRRLWDISIRSSLRDTSLRHLKYISKDVFPATSLRIPKCTSRKMSFLRHF